MILKLIGKLFFKITPWKITGHVPTEKKYIVLQAPHTSNWDFIIGKLFNFVVDMNPHIYIKKELFVFPIAFIFRWMKGIPVDRSKKTTLIEDTVIQIDKNEEFSLAITPEGSRSLRTEWKTGFYRLAVRTNLPVYLGYIDYKTKEVGCEKEPLKITDNLDEVMKDLKTRYSKYTARHPEKFGI